MKESFLLVALIIFLPNCVWSQNSKVELLVRGEAECKHRIRIRKVEAHVRIGVNISNYGIEKMLNRFEYENKYHKTQRQFLGIYKRVKSAKIDHVRSETQLTAQVESFRVHSVDPGAYLFFNPKGRKTDLEIGSLEDGAILLMNYELYSSRLICIQIDEAQEGLYFEYDMDGRHDQNRAHDFRLRIEKAKSPDIRILMRNEVAVGASIEYVSVQDFKLQAKVESEYPKASLSINKILSGEGLVSLPELPTPVNDPKTSAKNNNQLFFKAAK